VHHRIDGHPAVPLRPVFRSRSRYSKYHVLCGRNITCQHARKRFSLGPRRRSIKWWISRRPE
jgi:hypothetical protein